MLFPNGYCQLDHPKNAVQDQLRINMLKKIILVILLYSSLVCALFKDFAWSATFRQEADKAKWIKEFFKDKVFDPIGYARDAADEEKKFDDQLLADFISQNDIEHVEPIACGSSVTDPEIAQYNTSCPDKKPIDLYRYERGSPEIVEKELENPNYLVIDEYKCTGNLLIYKFNLYNKADNLQEYVLYCDNFKQIRIENEIRAEYSKAKSSRAGDVGAYLLIKPNQCLFSQMFFSRINPLYKNYLSGIFKYKGVFYVYETIKCYLR